MDTTSTFIATFAGVLASFLLWLLGEYIVKQRSQSKEREMMCKEVIDEAAFNIGVLDNESEFLKKSLSGGDIPGYLPRLVRSATLYAITSGNIRFLRSRKKQLLLYSINILYETHNRFIDNTEQILAILLLRDNSIPLVRHRLTRLCEHFDDTKKSLTKSINEFRQK